MPPASRKSAVLAELIRPIQEWEREQWSLLQPEVESRKTKHALIQKRVEELTRLSSKSSEAPTGTGQEKAQKSMQDYQTEIDCLKKELPELVEAPRIFISDTTAEGLQTELFEQGGSSAVISDEGNIFQIMAGLYSDGAANLDVFLNGYAGGSLRVKRRDRSINLPKTAVSFALAVQPQVLIDLKDRSRDAFRGKGLFARFLYCLPASNIGNRDVRKRSIISASHKSSYDSCIKSLLNCKRLNDSSIAMRTLTLSASALDVWHDFAQWVELRQGDGGEFESIQDFTGKLPGKALRIAAVCHLAEFSNSLNSLSPISTDDKLLQITESNMKEVVLLCKDLIVHAQAVLDNLTGNGAEVDAKQALQWIRKNLSKTEQGYLINQHEMHIQSKFKKYPVSRLKKALEVLTLRNLISEQMSLPAKKPKLVYFINPAVIEEGDQTKH